MRWSKRGAAVGERDAHDERRRATPAGTTRRRRRRARRTTPRGARRSRRRRDRGRRREAVEQRDRRAAGRTPSATSCACGCSIDAPDARPWFTSGCACTKPGLEMVRGAVAQTRAAPRSPRRARARRAGRRARATARSPRARRARRLADDRIQVRHDAHLPSGRVGRTAADARDLGRRHRFVTGAERARIGRRSPRRRSAVRRGTPRAGSRGRARRSRCVAGQLVGAQLLHVVRLGGSPARSLDVVPVRFVIIGGGPGGNTAATVAASLGAEVTLIERDVIGGAAHLWDCIPSKAMVATGNELAELARANTMGLEAERPSRRPRAARSASRAWRRRCATASRACSSRRACGSCAAPAGSPARTRSRPTTDDGVEEIEADAILLVDRFAPARARVGDDRRRAHPHDAPGVPAARDPRAPRGDRLGRDRRRVHAHVQRARLAGVADRVAPAGAADQGSRSRGRARERVPPARREAAEGRARDLDRARRRQGVHRVRRRPRGRRLARAARDRIAARTPKSLGCEAAGVVVDDSGYIPGNRHCQTNVPHIYSAGDISGRLPLSSVAAMQGRKIAEHVMGLTARAHRHLDYDKAAQAIFTDPEIAEVGVAEAEAFAAGPQAARHEGAVLLEPEVAHQRRRARLREDPLRPRDRRGARRRDRRPQRGRADLGDRGRGHEQSARSATSSTRCSCTPRWPSRSPKPRTDPCARSSPARPGSSAVISRRRCSRAATRWSASTASRRTTTGSTRSRTSRPRVAHDEFELVEADLRTADIERVARRRRRRVPPSRAGRRAAVVVGRVRRLRRAQRARDAAAARSGAARAPDARASCTRRRRRCTATSRATRRVETDLPKPFSPYGVTKLAAEHLCGLYAENWGVHTVSLRYFTVFGPRQRPDMSIHRLVRGRGRRHDVPALRRRHADPRVHVRRATSCAGNLAAADRDVAPGTYVQPRRRRRDHAQRADRAGRRGRGRAGRDRARPEAGGRLVPQRRLDRPARRRARLGAAGVAPRRPRRPGRLAPRASER